MKVTITATITKTLTYTNRAELLDSLMVQELETNNEDLAEFIRIETVNDPGPWVLDDPDTDSFKVEISDD